MSSVPRFVACGLAVLGALSLAACGSHSADTANAPAASSSSASANPAPAGLKITSWGPDSTKAGVAFNKQPDGSAALWIRVNQSLAGDEAAISFNGVLLQGNISGNLVTASVPADLYSKQGVYKVQVIARKSNQSAQSNDVVFKVE